MSMRGESLVTKPLRTVYRSPNRDKILDAAEIEFASNSYDTCSVRMIAETSGVNLGLLHYYFGSKQALFSAVFMRRATTLVERRFELLAEARLTAGKRSIPLEKVLRCFIEPPVEMLAKGPGPSSFIKLHSRLRTEPLDFARDLRREAFNDVNRSYIDAIHEACPHLTRAAVVWRFTAMVGAYLFLISQSGRVEDLSDGLCDPDNMEAVIDQVIPFCAAGFRTPDLSKKRPAKKKATVSRPRVRLDRTRVGT